MKVLKMLLLITPFVGMTFVGCTKDGSGKGDNEKMPAIDMAALDTTIAPQEDFYLYANAGWMAANPLKPAYSRYGAFDVLRDRSLDRLHEIVTELSDKADVKKGTNEYRVAVLYKQAMDSVTRNKLGAEPIKERLTEIEAIQDKDQLITKAAEWDNLGESTLFGTYVHADAKNSTVNAMHVYQPSLSLGNRDYYLAKDEEGLKLLESYNKFVKKILTLTGYTPEEVERIAENNLKIAKEIAEINYSQVELRDSKANYNMLDVKTFADTHKGFNWHTYIKGRGLEGLEKWNVSQIKFFEKYDKWFPKVDLRALKDYLIVSEIDASCGSLSDDFTDAAFEFYGKEISGRKEQHPRWRRAVDLVNGTLGEALGEVYVKRYFKPEAKEKMVKLVANLQEALNERIAGLTWMSEATKTKAQEKLAHFTVKIGYPDKWKDYSKLEIDEKKSYFDNLKAVSKFEHERNMEDLGKPVDRDRWLMNPQDANAYYMPTTNEICFPAGILQPPFFNVDADDAVNYGAIGVIIGHEMTHGFDDQGRNFDKDGNMNNWWTDEDAKKFEAAAANLAKQFDEIEVAPGIHANGMFTLGENIADQGGLLISHLAMQKALKGKNTDTIDGFTPEQRFYIAYARIWGQNITPEERIHLTKADEHSIGEYRVNQTLRNIEDFFRAFNVKDGNKMYLAPEKRVVIW